MAKGEIDAHVEEMLRFVQMSKFAQTQAAPALRRPATARGAGAALAKRPKILLLDEPLGALDKKFASKPSSNWSTRLSKSALPALWSRTIRKKP